MLPFRRMRASCSCAKHPTKKKNISRLKMKPHHNDRLLLAATHVYMKSTSSRNTISTQKNSYLAARSSLKVSAVSLASRSPCPPAGVGLLTPPSSFGHVVCTRRSLESLLLTDASACVHICRRHEVGAGNDVTSKNYTTNGTEGVGQRERAAAYFQRHHSEYTHANTPHASCSAHKTKHAHHHRLHNQRRAIIQNKLHMFHITENHNHAHAAVVPSPRR